MSRLGDKLSALSAPQRADSTPVNLFFAERGLTRNPFPPARTIWPEVLYDQDAAVQALADAIRDIVAPSPEKRALAIVGGTGEGKTHFLRHARLEFERLCKRSELRFALVEFAAGSGKIQAVVRSAFEAADAACQAAHAPDFVAALVDALRETDGDTLAAVRVTDVREALKGLVQARDPRYQPPSRARSLDFEALRGLFRRWISGASLDSTERKYLRVTDRIATGSMAVRVLTEMFSLARSVGVLHGMLLCLDEVETLFVGAQKMSSVQSFLLDLRYLFDEAGRYSLLLLSAATPKGAEYLQHVNQPVYQRLGFEQGSRFQLRPIEDALEARSFALEYIREEHERWRDTSNPSTAPRYAPESILADREIAEAFARAGGQTPPRRLPVSQSSLLNALHALVNEKRR